MPRKSGLWESGLAWEVRRVLSVDLGEGLSADLAALVRYLNERSAALDELARRPLTRSEVVRVAVARLIADADAGRWEP